MKLNQKILKAINEGIRKSLISFDDIEFEQSIDADKKVSNTISDWQWIQDNFVDLGLPSGTLWCKYNIGATCDNTALSWYGHYYMWGSIKPNDNDKCTWENTPFNRGAYCCDQNYFAGQLHEVVNQLGTIYPKYDVAYLMDNRMNIPTHELLDELCLLSNYWVNNHNDIDGLNGRVFVGNNGNELFMPAAGCHSTYNFNEGDSCTIWSSTIGSIDSYSKLDKAFALDFNNIGNADASGRAARYLGLPIRSVING